MRVRETYLVASREVRESLRGRWFWLMTACFLVLSVALSWLGLAGAQRSGLAGFDRTTASLLNLMLLFVPLMTLSLGGLNIVTEVEEGSLALLLAQPLTRSEVFVGKYAGLLAAISLAVLTGFGATGVIVGIGAGGGDVRAYLALIILVLLLVASTLAIGMMLSVAFRTRTRVIGAAFTVWLMLVYLSDLGTIGLVLARELLPGQVLALALLNPIQQARILGTMALTEHLNFLGPVALFGLDRLGRIGFASLLAGSLLATAFIAFWTGRNLFRRTVVL